MADQLIPVARRDRWRRTAVQYRVLCWMWIRSAVAYPRSFVLGLFAFMIVTGLDFVGTLVMFTRVHAFGGFSLAQMAILYGTAATSFGISDLIVGEFDRLGERIRTGEFDSWLIRPVPAFVWAAADHFALRRTGKVLQGAIVLGVALGFAHVDWTASRVAVLAGSLFTGAVIYACIFVLGSCLQFVAGDAAEFANAFTYGGTTINQYPLTVYGKDVVRALVFVVPLAFVNYFPVLYVVGHPVPYGWPGWTGLCVVPVAAVLVVLTALVWRTSVRRYRSSGS